MRGSPIFDEVADDTCGIIPAHAGLTTAPTTTTTGAGDHPRACGAHIPAETTLKQMKGSSPRMRGSLGIYGRAIEKSGIIPAHAGLTYKFVPQRDKNRDHPRACGAH